MQYAPSMASGLPPGAVLVPPPGATIIPAAGAPRAPAAPPSRFAQTPPPRPPVARGQIPDDAGPPVAYAPGSPGPRVAMPSPRQLNVASRPPDGACDWTAAHRHMQDLGVVTYQMDRPNADVYAFTCMLSTADPGRTHRIEAHGGTEAEAVRCALDEAQRWRQQRQ